MHIYKIENVFYHVQWLCGMHIICRSLFVLLSFFFRPLCCLSIFDLGLLITPLVSSNFSYQLYSHHFTKERFGPIKLAYLRHFSLKCMYQAKKMSGHVYMLRYQFCFRFYNFPFNLELFK